MLNIKTEWGIVRAGLKREPVKQNWGVLFSCSLSGQGLATWLGYSPLFLTCGETTGTLDHDSVSGHLPPTFSWMGSRIFVIWIYV